MSNPEKKSTAETVAWVLAGTGVVAGATYLGKSLVDAMREKTKLEAEAAARNAPVPMFQPAVPRPANTSTGEKVLGAVGSIFNALGGAQGILSLATKR